MIASAIVLFASCAKDSYISKDNKPEMQKLNCSVHLT